MIFLDAKQTQQGGGKFYPHSFFSMAAILQHMFELYEPIFTFSRAMLDLLMMVSVAALFGLYFMSRKKAKIYMLDFACYKPPSSCRLSMSMFLEHLYHENVDENTIAFQAKILEKSGFSDETYIPSSLTRLPKQKSLTLAIEEASSIMFSTVAELLRRNKIDPKSIDILISNCSLFCPVPSLNAMLVNRFRMRSDIRSFHLSGMGCSAGIVSVGLAKDLLRVHKNSLALIVSTEILHPNWYTGKNKSMLLTNCLFRTGGAAVLLSSRWQDRNKAKYELQHLIRTNKAQDDRSHACVIHDVDEEDRDGVSISKDIVNVAGYALRANIAALGPLIFPVSELFQYGFSLICSKLFTARKGTVIPNFKKAFEHFCIHAGGRAVIQAIETNLRLMKEDIEASKMTLYKFGNTSSSSIWYELCYVEAKGRMRKGDRVWQLAFGSGFKCNSATWRCVNDMELDEGNAWRDIIHMYPVEVPQSTRLVSD